MLQAKAQVQAVLCLVVAMALWGSSFIALKLAFNEIPPLWVIFARMALGSLVFLLAWRWRAVAQSRRRGRRPWVSTLAGEFLRVSLHWRSRRPPVAGVLG